MRRRVPKCAAVAVLTALLGACAPKAVQVAPPAEMPKAFSREGDAPLRQKWWTAFEDEKLNALMAEALEGNFTLRSAWDRLDQANAAAAKSAAPLLPGLDGSAGYSHTGRRATTAGRANTTWADSWSLGLSMSYEVDLWGRVRSTVDAAQLDARASAEDLHAAGVTLTGQVAAAWYRLVEQREQYELLGEQIATNKQYLEVITLRFRRGQVGATDVLQQQQLVEKIQGERVQVASAIEVLEHQLAILLGKPPGAELPTSAASIPAPPPLPAPGLPADLVRRRPDVRAAELRVRAADRRTAAAIADQFPKLGLTLKAETSAEFVRDLFDNWLASVAANLAAPLFDAGLRRAEVERTKAVVSERLNTYGQTVLTSLKEVEDALVQEARQRQYVASLARQLELARKATEQTRENYLQGSADFTRYLTTLLSYQQLQRTHLQARRDLVLFRIDLHRALAGGWDLPRTPPEQAPAAGPSATTQRAEEPDPNEHRMQRRD